MEHLYQYLRAYFRHCRSRRHVCVSLESRKEISNPFEELCENVFARRNTLGGLSDVQCEIAPPKEMDRILTARRTPIPAKITLAGENTYKRYSRSFYQVKS